MTISETGIYNTWLKAAVAVVYNIFVDKKFVFNVKPKQMIMELDETKIALGPYLLVIMLAMVALLLENAYNTHYNKDGNNKIVQHNIKVNIITPKVSLLNEDSVGREIIKTTVIRYSRSESI